MKESEFDIIKYINKFDIHLSFKLDLLRRYNEKYHSTRFEVSHDGHTIIKCSIFTFRNDKFLNNIEKDLAILLLQQ